MFRFALISDSVPIFRTDEDDTRTTVTSPVYGRRVNNELDTQLINLIGPTITSSVNYRYDSADCNINNHIVSKISTHPTRTVSNTYQCNIIALTVKPLINPAHCRFTQLYRPTLYTSLALLSDVYCRFTQLYRPTLYTSLALLSDVYHRNVEMI